MSTATAVAGHRVNVVRVLFGVAGMALLVALGFQVAAAGGWAWALAGFSLIAPDLAFLAAIGAPGPHRPGVLPAQAVPYYNATHRLGPPLVLTVVSFAAGWPAAIGVVALGWLAHVALDRAAGYGLRAADGTRKPVGR